MKRIISLILVAVIACSFVGCKGEENKTNHTTDVEYYAKLGKIPEMELALGASEDQVQKHYEGGRPADDDDGHDHILELNRMEGNLTVRLDAGNVLYYYEKAKKDNGVSVLISFDTAYDFEVGIAMPQDVKNAISAEGTLTDATSEQLFFLPFVEGDAKILTYNFDNIRLQFVFINDFLSATVLTDTNNWTD
ncbi:MAG: hypothetical protein IJN65_03740 [Clostridia bacterium]|nr:hypothetical protein [Clostridia bacterium]